MYKMGFHEQWVQIIMACVSSIRFQILHDGKEIGPIIPQWGLRQGDPLSLYLFIICVEALSSLIKSREAVGRIHGCQIVRGALLISHLFFMDDCFIFSELMKLNLISSDIFFQCMGRHKGSESAVRSPPSLLVVM